MGIKILINVGSENYSTSNKRFRQIEVSIVGPNSFITQHWQSSQLKITKVMNHLVNWLSCVCYGFSRSWLPWLFIPLRWLDTPVHYLMDR